MPSDVSQRVGAFDTFAGWSSKLASEEEQERAPLESKER
jgi:hypothetical protein